MMNSFLAIPSWQDLVQHSKNKLADWILASPLYDFVLAENTAPHFLVALNDYWSGDCGRGRWFCNGVLDCDGYRQDLAAHIWDTKLIYDAQFDLLHSFSWLRDLKALGGDQGRITSRNEIRNWIRKYPRWHRKSWRADLTAQRLVHWIRLFAFFGASADEAFHEIFFASLCKQYKHLQNNVPERFDSIESLMILEALISAALTLKGQELKLEKFLSCLDAALPSLILEDGGFATRSPKDLIRAVRILLDLKTALKECHYPVLPAIEHALDRAIPALRFFRHGDDKMALFHGTQEHSEAELAFIMKRAGLRGKVWSSLPISGFERIEKGKSLLLFDTGRPALSDDSRVIHAAPLAFEFSYGKDRIVTSCGSNPVQSEWAQAMRGTAAHSTAAIDDRNSFEIRHNGLIGRKSLISQWDRQDDSGITLLSASHDGYVSLNGFVHHRRLYMNEDGADLRGEDRFEHQIDSASGAHQFSIRFHLHPNVKISLVQQGREALLKTRWGSGWRFFGSGFTGFTLEDSVYIGQGTVPRRSQQIVLSGALPGHGATIKWAFQKEG